MNICNGLLLWLMKGLFAPPSVNFCNIVTDLRPSEVCVKFCGKHFIVNKGANVNWFEAERLCRKYGYLAEFENENQLDNMFQYLTSLGLLDNQKVFWTAGNDLGSEGSFYSDATGEPLAYVDWLRGEPDNLGGNEHCVQLKKVESYSPSLGMADAPCDRKGRFICEINFAKFHRNSII